MGSSHGADVKAVGTDEVLEIARSRGAYLLAPALELRLHSEVHYFGSELLLRPRAYPQQLCLGADAPDVFEGVVYGDVGLGRKKDPGCRRAAELLRHELHDEGRFAGPRRAVDNGEIGTRYGVLDCRPLVLVEVVLHPRLDRGRRDLRRRARLKQELGQGSAGQPR